jgi:hypothetical protein
MLRICHYFLAYLKTSFYFKCFLQYARNDLPKMYFEVIFKGLNFFACETMALYNVVKIYAMG